MGKRTSVEDRLRQLQSLRGKADTAEGRGELVSALKDRNNLVVARAAEVVGGEGLRDLAPALEEAFGRLYAGEVSDKGCSGMTAIAAALHGFEAAAEGVFLEGIRHVQKEASWGPAVDVAVGLRGICAMGLVQTGYRRVLFELADLLADPEARARVAAATALGCCAREEAGALLRLKARLGDAEADVTAECLNSLVKLKTPGWLSFVAGFLDSSDEALRGAAGLALGESRDPGAFEALRERWESTFEVSRRMELMLPMAVVRVPAGVDFLVGVVSDGPVRLAAAAVRALGLYRGDAGVRERVRGAVGSREDSDELLAAFAGSFEK